MFVCHPEHGDRILSSTQKDLNMTEFIFTVIYLIYCLQRAQTEAVTFLGNQDSSRSLYAIPGLDYVAHEDILPYTTSEKPPLHHELFDKFLLYYPDKGEWKLICK